MQACWEFDCEILVLHHPTTISSKYGRWSAMVHCGSIRQTAQILQMSKECLRTGDKAVVRFRFIKNPEYMKPGQRMVMLMLEQIFYMLIYVYVYLKVFREGRTKAVGNVITPLYTAGSVQQRSKPNKMQGRMGSAMNQQQMASKPLSKSTNDAALEEQPLGNSEVLDIGVDKRNRAVTTHKKHRAATESAKESLTNSPQQTPHYNDAISVTIN